MCDVCVCVILAFSFFSDVRCSDPCIIIKLNLNPLRKGGRTMGKSEDGARKRKNEIKNSL